MAIHVTGIFRNSNHQNWMKEIYNQRPDNQNFYRFVYIEKSKSINFPELKSDFAVQPVMTLELLKYFFVKKTSLFHKLSIEELQLIQSAYRSYFDLSQIQIFKFIPDDNRPFRFLSHFQASLYLGDRLYHGVIHNISGSGAYITLPQFEKRILKKGEAITIHFNLNSQIQEINGTIIHRNEEQNELQAKGIGVQFDRTYSQLLNAIHDMHLNRTTPFSNERKAA